MNPTVIQSQLTQVFSNLHQAQVAYAVEMQQPGQKIVRFYALSALQVDDLRTDSPTIGVYQANGTPLYVVQTDYS